MAKTKKPELTSVTVRMEKKLVEEIEEIAKSLYSTRTVILNECVKLGLEALKNKKPELVEMVNANRERKKNAQLILVDKK